jgi:prepilin-type N-terminal cleavage/methylation domain-containing protein
MFIRKINSHAFTLIELIVVITILTILSSLALVSFQWYLSNSRDTVRITDLKNIDKALNITETVSNVYPFPDDAINVKMNGKILNYQWTAGKKVQGIINIFNWWKDPKNQKFYTYSTNAERTKYQLLGYLENPEYAINIIWKTHADTWETYPKILGDELWFILNTEKFEPIQYDIDLPNISNTYTLLLNEKDSFTTQSWSLLMAKMNFRIHEKWDCSAILKNWRSTGNGIYTIYPKSWDWFEVYCDMENGWYTGLFSVNPWWTTWKYNSSEWKNPTVKENNFISEETTYKSYSELDTLNIKMCRWDINSCYTFKHNKNIPLKKFYTDNISYLDFSVFNEKKHLDLSHSHNRNPPENYWADNKNLFLSQLHIPYDFNTKSYNKYWAWINLNLFNKIWFQADNNNSWPIFDNIWHGVGVFASRPRMITPCIWGNPILEPKAISTLISWWKCYYDNPDSKMWYIFGK